MPLVGTIAFGKTCGHVLESKTIDFSMDLNVPGCPITGRCHLCRERVDGEFRKVVYDPDAPLGWRPHGWTEVTDENPA